MFIDRLRSALRKAESSRYSIGLLLIGSEKPIEGKVVKGSVDEDSFVLNISAPKDMTVSMGAVAAFTFILADGEE